MAAEDAFPALIGIGPRPLQRREAPRSRSFFGLDSFLLSDVVEPLVGLIGFRPYVTRIWCSAFTAACNSKTGDTPDCQGRVQNDSRPQTDARRALSRCERSPKEQRPRCCRGAWPPSVPRPLCCEHRRREPASGPERAECHPEDASDKQSDRRIEWIARQHAPCRRWCDNEGNAGRGLDGGGDREKRSQDRPPRSFQVQKATIETDFALTGYRPTGPSLSCREFISALPAGYSTPDRNPG